MQIWHFNRLSNNSHSTTIQHQISYQYRYFIQLRESQCPNRALPQPLPSIVQTVSGLTLNRGLPELRTVLRSRWSLGGKIKGQNTQSWIKYDYWYYIWHCYVFKCEWFDNLLKNCQFATMIWPVNLWPLQFSMISDKQIWKKIYCC